MTTMSFVLENVWLVPLLPVIAFLVIVFLTRTWPRLSCGVALAGMGGSFTVASLAAVAVLCRPELIDHPLVYGWDWFSVGGSAVRWSLLVDPFSVMMLWMVSLVSLLVFIYSSGYMRTDKGYAVFFAYLSLFAASMLCLVVAGNLLQLFLCWEAVGLCSYLLIGFWWHKIPAREAAKKAFITCRVADFGFLVALVLIYLYCGTLDLAALPSAVSHLTPLTAGAIALLLFVAAMGKSAQFPLHVWLPDAMQGPTPVSALIHAATMVVAGVYLVGRMLFLYSQTPEILTVIAVVGGFTAFLAATIACTQTDFKGILAYSTISQIGYMMLGMGAGSLSAGAFHLWTHAFFKALLFLGAGCVIYAAGGQGNILRLGGMGKRLPLVSAAFICGALALAGFPPFSSFWSKDEILANCLDAGYPLLFGLGMLTVFLTAYYIGRLVVLVFFRRPPDAEADPRQEEPMPRPMVFSVGVLALLALVAGLVGTPWVPWFQHWIHWGPDLHAAAHTPHYACMALSSCLAAAGLALAWLRYLRDTRRVHVHRCPLHRVVAKKYYIDELYAWGGRVFVYGTGRLIHLFDIHIVDGIVNGVGGITRWGGAVLCRLQNGQVQTYGLGILAGVLVLLIYAL